MFINESGMHITPLTEGPYSHFFGYYGRSPWNSDSGRILAHRTAINHRPPMPDDIAVVGYVDVHNSNSFQVVSDTAAWNFQQGAMLHWINRNSDECIIHNTRDDRRFTSQIISPQTGLKEHLPIAVYCLDHTQNYALSLNFSRLHELRPGYGYAGLPDPFRDEIAPGSDGIYLLDINAKKYGLLLSLKQIAECQPLDIFRKSKQWVNHLMFAPSGNKFCFLHRCITDQGYTFTRLMTANVDGTNLKCIYSGMVSHMDWQDENTIIAWAGQRKMMDPSNNKSLLKSSVIKLLKPLYHSLGKPRWIKKSLLKDGYFLVYDDFRIPVELDIKGHGIDGHCSFDPSGRWIVTDSYPDHKSDMKLLLYDICSGQTHPVCQLNSDVNLRDDYRCDLHPRWNRSNPWICFDSSHEGRRQMYMVDVSEIINKTQSLVEC